MGEHAAVTARDWGVRVKNRTRWRSPRHPNMAAAYKGGFYADLVTPYLGVERDENLRPDSSVEQLAKLKPVFGGEDAR